MSPKQKNVLLAKKFHALIVTAINNSGFDQTTGEFDMALLYAIEDFIEENQGDMRWFLITNIHDFTHLHTMLTLPFLQWPNDHERAEGLIDLLWESAEKAFGHLKDPQKCFLAMHRNNGEFTLLQQAVKNGDEEVLKNVIELYQAPLLPDQWERLFLIPTRGHVTLLEEAFETNNIKIYKQVERLINLCPPGTHEKALSLIASGGINMATRCLDIKVDLPLSNHILSQIEKTVSGDLLQKMLQVKINIRQESHNIFELARFKDSRSGGRSGSQAVRLIEALFHKAYGSKAVDEMLALDHRSRTHQAEIYR